MDGNFSAEHMKHWSGEQDVSLSSRMAFMANPETYKDHLWSGEEVPQVHMYILLWMMLVNYPIEKYMQHI